MAHFPLYIFIAAVLHVTEEYYYPGGFMDWAKKHVPRAAHRITVKFAIIVNGLFLMLCAAGVILGGYYPAFALSLAGLVLVNGAGHLFTSIATRSYSPGLITSLLLYIPISLYIFMSLHLGSFEIFTVILYGFLYHAIVPLFLFSPFNRPKP